MNPPKLINLRLPADYPYKLFVMQVLFYAVQAVSGTFIVVYFGGIGFSTTQIGLMTSVSTLAVLLTQPLWGYASDRAADGRTILSVLFLACGVLAFGYFFSTNYIVLLLLYTAYIVFYNPIPPIMDSLTLEALERERSRFDYGKIRIGGVVGYCVMVLVTGRLLTVSHRAMFVVTSVLCLIALIFVRRLDAVKLRGKREKLSFRALLADKRIFCYMFLNLVHAFGSMGFYTYYSLHFSTVIADSAWLGALLFAAALSELPFWFIAKKAVRRFGYDRMMLCAIALAGVRWLSLCFLTNIPLIFLVNLLNGFCFVTVTYSMVTYINEKVPGELRATGQTMNNLFAMVFSRVIGGVAFGAFSEYFGITTLLFWLAMFTFASVIVFFIWTKSLSISEKIHANGTGA